MTRNGYLSDSLDLRDLSLKSRDCLAQAIGGVKEMCSILGGILQMVCDEEKN